MPLSEQEITDLGELVGESYVDTASALAGVLTGLAVAEVTAVENQLRDLTSEYAPIKNENLRAKDFDLGYEVTRARLRQAARVALKLSSASSMPTFFTAARGCRGR